MASKFSTRRASRSRAVRRGPSVPAATVRLLAERGAEAYDEALRAQVAQKGDITLIELQAWLAGDHTVKVSVGCRGRGSGISG